MEGFLYIWISIMSISNYKRRFFQNKWYIKLLIQHPKNGELNSSPSDNEICKKFYTESDCKISQH